MARTADEVIERIKSEVSLVRLAESQGYTLVKHGRNDFALCCPFHADKTPSCIISPQSNLFNCFGCGAGGSVIDWVMKTQGVNFRHAVELLKNDYVQDERYVAGAGMRRSDPSAISPLAAESPIKKTTVPKLAAPVCRVMRTMQRCCVTLWITTMKPYCNPLRPSRTWTWNRAG